MTLKTKETLSLAAVLGLIVLGALAGALLYFRIDLTSTGSFTISPVTRTVLGDLDDEMVLTYFVSKELKANSPIPQSLEDLLNEYTAAGGGRVKLQVVDPAESGRLGEAQQLGLQPLPLQITSNNTFTQVETYTGLLIEYQDKKEVIPMLDQVETLEYELTSRIRQLQGVEKTKFGVLVGNTQYTPEQGLQYISRYLGQEKTLVFLDSGAPIDPTIKVVVVLGDQTLSDLDVYHLDQYMMTGGKIFFAVDGVDVNIQSQDTTTNIRASVETPVKKWLKHLGVTIEPSLVLDSTGSMLQNLGGGLTLPTAYPQWVGVVVQNTSATHPVTSRFGGLTLLWTSAVTVEPKTGFTAERLIWSTPKSWLMKEGLTLDPEMGKFSLQLSGKDTQKSYDLAYALSGTFTSFFADKPLPAGVSGEVVKSSPETRLLVVGDSDFGTDLLGQTVTGQGNLNFLDNGVDWLAQDEALLSIKSRPQRDRTLSGLKAEDGRAALAYWSLIGVNVVIIPLGVILFGLVRSARRSSKEKGEKP